MKVFFSFVHKECLHILRDMRTMLIVLLMPVVLVLLFGFAITTEIKNIDVMVVIDRMTPEVRSDINALENNPYVTFKGAIQEREIDAVLRRGDCAAVVMFGSDGKRNVVLDASNSSMSASIGSYIISIIDDGPSKNAMPITTYMRHNPQLKSAYNFVPGVMGLIFILICSMMTCASVAREKEMGTLEVLLVSPIKPVYVVVSKMIPYFVISIINLATIFLISQYVLEMPILENLPTLLVLNMLYIALSLAIGLLVSTLSNNQMVALLICAMVMMVPMMMLSGMLFPVENLPLGLKQVSYLIPARWYIEATRKVMVEGLGIVSIWKEMIILIGMTVVVFVACIKKFNDRLE